MKSKMDKYNLILVGLFMFLVILTILWKMPQKEDQYVHVGIAAYDLDDTFMESYIKDLQDKMEQMKIEGKKVSYEIYDAKGSSRKQEKQLQRMYAQKYDVILVNLVEPSSAASMINDAEDADIPVILFNREADDKDLKIVKKVWYVGTDAKAAGAMQGEMLKKIWEEQKGKIDWNKNGKLDYVLVEGEETHFDAIRRTNGFLESSEDMPMNQRANLSADWKRELATTKFAKLDKEIINNAEAVICNNDDMALGVYDYYKKHHLQMPVILGINNSPEMNRKIMTGEIYGTVDNKMEDQVGHICQLMKAILKENTKKYKKVWYSTPHAITRTSRKE